MKYQDILMKTHLTKPGEVTVYFQYQGKQYERRFNVLTNTLHDWDRRLPSYFFEAIREMLRHSFEMNSLSYGPDITLHDVQRVVAVLQIRRYLSVLSLLRFQCGTCEMVFQAGLQLPRILVCPGCGKNYREGATVFRLEEKT